MTLQNGSAATPWQIAPIRSRTHGRSTRSSPWWRSRFRKSVGPEVMDYLKKRSWSNDTVSKLMAWMTDNQATRRRWREALPERKQGPSGPSGSRLKQPRRSRLLSDKSLVCGALYAHRIHVAETIRRIWRGSLQKKGNRMEWFYKFPHMDDDALRNLKKVDRRRISGHSPVPTAMRSKACSLRCSTFLIARRAFHDDRRLGQLSR